MKPLILSALLVGIVSTTVSAQSLAGLPTCAYSCVEGSIPNSCNLSPACICEQASFIAAVTCCVVGVCDEADQKATLKYAKKICDSAGVTLTQTAAVCASTASSNGTHAATGSSTHVPASVSSSISSSLASASSSLSSAISSISSAATTAATAAATSKAGAEQLLAQGGNVFAAIVAAAALL